MTNVEFAILSLIVEQPRHGYEIEQVIEERGMREWTEIGFSSIYYVLKKLEKSNLVIGQTKLADGRGPARKVYSPTAIGINACQQATIKALEMPHRCYPPIQLGMANLEQVTLAEALEALKCHRDGLSKRLANIQSRRTEEPIPEIVETMFDYSFTMVEAEKNWIDKFIAYLEEKEK